MTTLIESYRPQPTTQPVRTVAVVSRDPQQSVFDSVLRAVDHEVVFVESIAHAYSHIKSVTPDLVIVCLASDDADGCQVLSMLALDAATASIPVITFFTPPAGNRHEAGEDEIETDDFGMFGGLSVN